jgi:hypothetical protein
MGKVTSRGWMGCPAIATVLVIPESRYSLSWLSIMGGILGVLTIRDLLFNKIPGFTWRGEAAPSETWDFIGILFYGKPLRLPL